MDHAEQFWGQVHQGPGDQCWPWTGKHDTRGFGYLYWHGRNHMAHRIAWELTHGPIQPVELTIGHLCRRKECQNPDHMELLTREENGHRGYWDSLAWHLPRYEIARKARVEREAHRQAAREAQRSTRSSPVAVGR